MSVFRKLLIGAATTMMFASVAAANTYRAADLVYMPAVARTAGGAGTFFKTDVVIANLSNDTIQVDVVYLPTGNSRDNRSGLDNFVTLPNLAPGERRVIDDFMKASFNLDEANGHALFFACRAGGNCNDCDANGGDCRLISVTGRIYNETSAGTFGQLFPGLPWYSRSSLDDVGFDSDRVLINGIRNEGTAGVSGYRTNIGLVNFASYTSTTVQLTLFNSQNQQIGQANVTLAPLAHHQQNVTALFPGFTGTGYIRARQTSATPASGEEENINGFFAYGSLIDNRTGDPTTLESVFEIELPLDCLVGSKPLMRGVVRP